jgi:HNH endonuclease
LPYRDARTIEAADQRWQLVPAVETVTWEGSILDCSIGDSVFAHRDGGCRFPGCGVRFGQGHHIQHWAQGGPTTLSNLAILCRRHHRAVHEEGVQIEREPDGELRFRGPAGQPLPEVPPAPWVADDPLGVLRSWNRAAGLNLYAHTATPQWLGERLDVGYAIDVLHPRASY